MLQNRSDLYFRLKPGKGGVFWLAGSHRIYRNDVVHRRIPKAIGFAQ